MDDSRYCILEKRGNEQETLFFEGDSEDFTVKLLEQLKKDAYKRKVPVEYRMISIAADVLRIGKEKPKTVTKKAKIITLDIPKLGKIDLQVDG